MTEAISRLDSDLIGVAEYEPSEPAELYDLVADSYPYHVFYPGDTDVGLLSRYPILSQQLIAPADMRSAFIRGLNTDRYDSRTGPRITRVPVSFSFFILQFPR